MSRPEVSVILAAHNEGEHLRRTLDSLEEGCRGCTWEAVLVDDGSDDGSLDGLPGAFRFPERVGCVRARHQGVRLARGEYVVFLDAHVAVEAGFLEGLLLAARRRGPLAAVAPAVGPLDPEGWRPLDPYPTVLAMDETWSMAWIPVPYPTGLIPTVGGMCFLLPRHLYLQAGGFDLGLRLWGSEFLDLTLKIYAAGGAVFHEPSVRIGHLFRRTFPYAMDFADITYNKLRSAFVHLSPGSFARLLPRLAREPGYPAAMEILARERSELEHLRRFRRDANRRHPDWFVRTFLPALCP